MQPYPAGISSVAKGLAKNPLGIIALFIVFVYLLASLVLVANTTLLADERIIIIYFLVFFPVLVLCAFFWLVTKHSSKLFAPSDFSNEDNYVKMQMIAVGNLAAASVKIEQGINDFDMSSIINNVNNITDVGILSSGKWRSSILWVDDRPENNIYERRAFQAVGFEFTISETTNDALDELSKNKFAAIISDMGRREGPQEGYVLLEEVRKRGDATPFFIYAGSNAPHHTRMALERGAQGNTNNANELFKLVTRHIITGS